MRIDDKGEEDEGIYRNNQQIPIEGKIKLNLKRFSFESQESCKIADCVIFECLGQQYYKCLKYKVLIT